MEAQKSPIKKVDIDTGEPAQPKKCMGFPYNLANSERSFLKMSKLIL